VPATQVVAGGRSRREVASGDLTDLLHVGSPSRGPAGDLGGGQAEGGELPVGTDPVCAAQRLAVPVLHDLGEDAFRARLRGRPGLVHHGRDGG
jgi:hypothetical protein